MKVKNKNFASFNQAQAFKQLNISRLLGWKIEAQAVKASECQLPIFNYFLIKKVNITNPYNTFIALPRIEVSKFN